MSQQTFGNEEDEFVKSLNLNDDKIKYFINLST